jgi:type IV pilus assembly protein PilV
MLPPVLHTEKGFTLVEFAIAVFILMIGLLGLLETVNIAMRRNLGNKLRNDAIMLADREMATQRVSPFAGILATNIKTPASADNSFMNYSVVKVVVPLTATSKNVSVNISWREYGLKKTHSLSTVITNESAN